MNSDMESEKIVTEAVGIFHEYDALQATIKDLGANGFGRHQISVRGNDLLLDAQSTAVIPPYAFEDNPGTPRSPLIGAEELGIAQGVLVGASIYVGASFAFYLTGGMTRPYALPIVMFYVLFAGAMGILFAQWLGQAYRRFFEKQRDAGGLVLWVETPEPQDHRKAETILRNHGAEHVHLHRIAITG